MKNGWRIWKDGAFTLAMLAWSFGVTLLCRQVLGNCNLATTVFVLGVFLISVHTDGYGWGIAASLAGVMLVNFAFTEPYDQFDFITPENLISAAVMLAIACVTSAMTAKLKIWEKARRDGEKEKMRANLLRAVSHDLRTPLTSIYGSTSTVIENYDRLSRAQQLGLLEGVRSDAEWLIHMVENLLSVTRIDGEKAGLTKTSVPLEELVDAVLVKFKQRWPDCPVTLEFPEEFLCVSADAMLIQQVLTNLLENAVYHASGMTELRLTVRREGGKALLRVEDDGCGISRERLADLFTGYSGGGTEPADRNRSSMGIGLSVCATIVKAHGGEIRGGNRPEGGAFFEFSLDLEENERE